VSLLRLAVGEREEELRDERDPVPDGRLALVIVKGAEDGRARWVVERKEPEDANEELPRLPALV
jgi:hypothetical protein